MSQAPAPRHKILFVDDDPAFLTMIQRVMTVHSRGGWVIHTAESASRAMALLQQESMDLIAIDVQMPVVDGLQFLTLLNRRYPNLPKVVLTGFATEAYRVACLSNGAELFLEKPMTPADQQALHATLNEVMKFQPEAEDGFQGVLRRVGLPDVIQMECLSTNSCVLEITGRHGSGCIYIHEGAIIHAESESQRGEEAFHRLLSLRGGEFKLEKYRDPPQRTIEAPWEFLVMEAARKRDEMVGQAASERESATPAVAAPDHTTGEGAVEPTSEAHDGDVESEGSESATPGLAEPAPAGPPRVIEELMVCTGDGTVLEEWQVRNTDLWVNFIEFLSQKARRLGQSLPFGSFKKLEAAEADERLIVLIREDRGVLVRCREEAD